MNRNRADGLNRTGLVDALSAGGPRVVLTDELRVLINRYWNPVPFSTLHVDEVISWLVDNTSLRELSIRSDLRTTPVMRHVWGDASPYQVALSLARGAYLSHLSAAVLHGLLPGGGALYVNDEQTPKPRPTGLSSQESVNRAFNSKQRLTRNRFSWKGGDAVVVNGKFTDRLGVTTVAISGGITVPATSVERTLIDITVRPAYGNGPSNVLAAYRAARPRVDTSALAALLDKLSYIYPYDQAIGFYLQRSGYSAADLQPFRRSTRLDFYVDYAMRSPLFDDDWRVFYPRNL